MAGFGRSHAAGRRGTVADVERPAAVLRVAQVEIRQAQPIDRHRLAPLAPRARVGEL